MALIFDRFPSVEAAARFTAAVKEKGRDSRLYTNTTEAANEDFFPFTLEGVAAVLVERSSEPLETEEDWRAYAESEDEIIALVKDYDGQFAGT